jgi:hypothetical protein
VEYFTHRGWDVHVTHLVGPFETLPDYEEMSRRCTSLDVYMPSVAEKARREGSDRCDDWCPDGFARLVADRCAALPVQAVVTQFVFLSRCLSLITDPCVIKVIDADNIFAYRREAFARAGLDYWWFSTTEDDETQCLQRADLLLAVQADEARVLAERSRRPVLVVPHAVEVRPCAPTNGSVVLYVGSSNPVNVAAIRGFVQSGLPAVRDRIPHTELVVCGDISRHVPSSSGVRSVGIVSDLHRWYSEAMLVINPAAAGTGVSIKTIDALAHGKCLVTTQAGSSGIPRVATAARVVPTPADVAPAVVRLLSRPKEVHAHERAAAELAHEEFAPPVVFGPLERLLLSRSL